MTHDEQAAPMKAIVLWSGGLDKHIDGITGATLSVWAVTHVAELALYLSRQVMMDLQLEPDIPSQSSEDE